MAPYFDLKPYGLDLTVPDHPQAMLEVAFFKSRRVRFYGFRDGTETCESRMGIWKFYSPYRESRYQLLNFENGMPHGPAFVYKGAWLQKEGQYSFGKKSGVWKIYREDGSLQKEKVYQP